MYNEHPSTTNLKFNESFIRGVTKKWKITQRKDEIHILSVLLNLSSCFTLSFTRLTLKTSYEERSKLMKSFLKKNTLSDFLQSNPVLTDTPTSSQVNHIGSKNESKMSSKIMSLLSFGRKKNNDYELPCYRRLNLLKEPKLFECFGVFDCGIQSTQQNPLKEIFSPIFISKISSIPYQKL